MDTNAIEELLNEQESTSLDFKRDQYLFVGATESDKSELLKDVLAFANAWRRSDAFIMIGVDEMRGGRSVPVGVSSHLDDASLQQFINSKVQRPVAFSYKRANVDGCEIGVIEIPLQERPLYLTKDYGRLQKGIVYIRRGSSTGEATPDEVAKMGAVSAGLARPKLSLVCRRVKERETQIVLGIKNETSASAARAPYLAFELPKGFMLALHGLDGNGSNGLRELPQPGSEWRKPEFVGSAAEVVHGGTTHWITRIATNESLTEGVVTVAYEVAAENVELVQGMVDIDVTRIA